MSFGSNVQPRHRVKEAPKAWAHCGLNLAGYLTRCPDCGTRRDSPNVHVRDARAISWNTNAA